MLSFVYQAINTLSNHTFVGLNKIQLIWKGPKGTKVPCDKLEYTSTRASSCPCEWLACRRQWNQKSSMQRLTPNKFRKIFQDEKTDLMIRLVQIVQLYDPRRPVGKHFISHIKHTKTFSDVFDELNQFFFYRFWHSPCQYLQ